MIKKFIGALLCLSLLFSASVTAFGESSYTFKKIENEYCVLTGKVTKISAGRIKLTKISDELWSDNIGYKNKKVDDITLDTTNFEDKEFCDGDVIRAYFESCSLDYSREIDNYAFKLRGYEDHVQQISVNEKANFLQQIGVLNGDEFGNLYLERNITRAEFTTLMVKIYNRYEYMHMSEYPSDSEVLFPFKDVPEDHWARKYIEYAYSNGIINGKDKNTFAPDKNITIRDCIVVLLNANAEEGYQRQHLLDTAKELGGYPDGYIKIAKENELIIDELPEKIASRGDIVTILYNVYYTKANFEYITAGKPVIYLYPQKETNVNVEVYFNGDFTFTYPEYNHGWTVTAKPDGTLVSDITEYPYLFWEGKVMNYMPKFDEGFLVSRKETVSFLEEKLEILGLNEKERADFITYWAPQLIKNNFNIIKFDTKEYASKVSLNIEPQPDSVIRVFMVYKVADETESIKKQELDRVERKGFVAVEWGGAIEE